MVKVLLPAALDRITNADDGQEAEDAYGTFVVML